MATSGLSIEIGSTPRSLPSEASPKGLPRRFEAGRYHSIFASPEGLPPELAVTATTDDGVIMGVEHTELPVAAVQFHPESLMTTRRDVGLRLIENVVRRLSARPQA